MFSMLNATCQSATATIAVAVAVIVSWHCDSFSADEPQGARPPTQLGLAHASVSGDPVRAAIERLSAHDIKALYERCSQEVAERKLDGGEIMICSIGYDVLLRKHFSGNFDSLLAWSRAQQNGPIKGNSVKTPGRLTEKRFDTVQD